MGGSIYPAPDLLEEETEPGEGSDPSWAEASTRPQILGQSRKEGLSSDPSWAEASTRPYLGIAVWWGSFRFRSLMGGSIYPAESWQRRALAGLIRSDPSWAEASTRPRSSGVDGRGLCRSSDPSWAEASTRPLVDQSGYLYHFWVPIPHGRKHLPGRTIYFLIEYREFCSDPSWAEASTRPVTRVVVATRDYEGSDPSWAEASTRPDDRLMWLAGLFLGSDPSWAEASTRPRALRFW